MTTNLRTGLRQSIKSSLETGLVGGDIFGTSKLDLRFAQQKTLDPRVTFTRASSATFVDSSGVLRSAVTNLLLRSEEFDNASWTPIGLLAFGSGSTANAIASPNGQITADLLTESTTTGTHQVQQTASVTIGQVYTYSVFCKLGPNAVRRIQLLVTNVNFTVTPIATFDLTTGTVVSVVQGTASITSYANGWYRLVLNTIAATSTGVNGFHFRLVDTGTNNSYTGDGSAGLYLWGAQLEQASTVGDYVPTGATINSAPRFDHDPTTGESLGFLIEEGRTNLYSFSEQFDDASWAKGNADGTITADQSVSPNGTTTADLYQENTAATTSRYIAKSISITSGQAYSISCWAKQGPGATRYLGLVLTTTGFGANVNASFTLSGVGSFNIASSGTATSASIQAFPGGWYRCTLISQATATVTLFPQIRLSNSPTSGISSYTGDGTSGIYIWGAQLEAGSFPTSYIPTTTGATVTRAADVASITGANFGVTRTNLLVRSEEFDNAAWTKTRSSVTANAITAPNGTLTADQLVEDTTVTSTHNIGQSISFTSGTTYTVSVFAKATASPRFLQIIFPSGAFTATRRPVFDLLNGIASAATDTTASIQNIGDGWYRCIASMLATNTNSASIQLQLANTYINSAPTYTGDGTSGIYLWGAQLEAGSAVTPYIQSPSVFTSRASSGTYVGGNGLIQTAVTNLLLRSEEFDNAAWTKTRSSITSNTIVAPDGTLTGDKLVEDTTASNTHQVSQSASLTAGTHTYSIFAKAGERSVLQTFRSNLNIDLFTHTFNLSTGTASGTGASIVSVGNGWYLCISTVTVNTTGSTGINFSTNNGSTNSYTGNGTSGLYLWGAQLEQSSSVGEYIPTTSAINSAARYDHDPVSLISKGLLLEEARTNNLLQSEDFSSTWILSNIAVTANSVVAPDGTTTADTIAPPADGLTATRYLRQNPALTTQQAYTFSVFVKVGTATTNGITLFVSDSSATVNFRANFNLFTQITSPTSSTWATPTATIVPYPNGWYRCILSGVTSTEHTGLRANIYLNTFGTTSDTYGTHHIWGAQLEAGSFPTSYIPTTTATVTRAADISTSVATSVFESSWYRQDEGTVLIDMQRTKIDKFPRRFRFTDGTSANVIASFWDASLNSSTFSITTSSVNQVAIFGGGGALEVFAKAGFGLKNNDTAVFYGGVQTGGTQTSVSLPVVSEVEIASNAFNGWVKRLTYWPTRLANTTLQRITQP
jgi:hypothetical protein